MPQLNLHCSPSELLGAILVSVYKLLILSVFTIGALVVLPFKAITWLLFPAKPTSFNSICITGASSGIGAELARQYAAPGVRLVLTARRVDRLEAVKDDCVARGAEVVICSVDVNDVEATSSALLAADDERPIDLLIANAGVHPYQLSSHVDRVVSAAAAAAQSGQASGQAPCREVMVLAATLAPVTDCNVCGVVNTVAPLLTRMQSRAQGQIVLTASVASYCAMTDHEWVAYHASKVWVRSFGMGLRGLLQPYGVGVTVLCPGLVASEMATSINSRETIIKNKAVPTGVAVAAMRRAIGTNVGVHVMREHSSEMQGVYFLGYNVLPPFAFNAMMAGFRMEVPPKK